ncbi:MAG TPA: N-acetylmuramoyl-L-alanine amidase [Acidisarcina sp.]
MKLRTPVTALLLMSTCCALQRVRAQQAFAAGERAHRTGAAHLLKVDRPGRGNSVNDQQQSFLVLIDPAHGGADAGARLSDRLLEKDLTLSLAARLHAALVNDSIPVVVTRDSDATVSNANRAQLANRSGADACIILHATSAGTGVHLFTSSLSVQPVSAAAKQTSASQAASALDRRTSADRGGSTRLAGPNPGQQRLRLASAINEAFTRAEIPTTLGRTSLQPLDSFDCPAVAVELAPLTPAMMSKGALISDSGYQASFLHALEAALMAWRGEYRSEGHSQRNVEAAPEPMESALEPLYPAGKSILGKP